MQPVRSVTVLGRKHKAGIETIFARYCQVGGGQQARQVIMGNGVSAGQKCDFNRKSEESGVTGLDKMTVLGMFD